MNAANSNQSAAELLTATADAAEDLVLQAKDTLGVIDEYLAMPCDSLRQRLHTARHRLDHAYPLNAQQR